MDQPEQWLNKLHKLTKATIQYQTGIILHIQEPQRELYVECLVYSTLDSV